MYHRPYFSQHESQYNFFKLVFITMLINPYLYLFFIKIYFSQFVYVLQYLFVIFILYVL